MSRAAKVMGAVLVGGSLLARTPTATPIDGNADVHATLRAATKDVQLVVLKDGCGGECQAETVKGLSTLGCDQVRLFPEVAMVSAHCVPTTLKRMAGGMVDLTTLPGVETAVPDEVVSVIEPTPAGGMAGEGGVPVTQQASRFWGLDRFNQFSLPLDGSTTQPCFPKRGAGVTVYVLDTGINSGHSQFGSRATAVVPPGAPCTSGFDGEGHVSHVAGTVGGTTAGVAPWAAIAEVKCLNDRGGGRVVDVVAAIDYLAGKKRANRGAKVFIKASLGSDRPSTEPWTVEAPNGASLSRNQVMARLTKGAPNVGGYPMPWASSMC